MSRIHCAAFVLTSAALSPALSSQVPFHVSYPHDATTGTSGNNIAFGISSNSGLDEGRYQLLIPARYLPSTGAAFLGFEVVSHGITSHSLTFQSLQITLSHDARASLDPVTANNLPNPVVVLNGQNLTLSYTRRQWSPIRFTMPFIYDGVSDLVVDVQKVFDRNVSPIPVGGSSMQTTGDPGRPDLPRARWEFGALGSGASAASNTRFFGDPLFLRLHAGSLPTTALRGDAGGTSGNFYALGQSFDVEVRASAGTTFATFVGGAFQSPPVSIPVLGGSLHVLSPFTFKFGVIGAGNLDLSTIPIPNNAAFVGAQLVWQSAVLPPGMGVSPQWTCATDLFVNS